VAVQVEGGSLKMAAHRVLAYGCWWSDPAQKGNPDPARAGSMLKEIGTGARHQWRRSSTGPVYLEFVRQGWCPTGGASASCGWPSWLQRPD